MHRRRRQGGWGAAALPTLEKFAKISHNRAENRPKIGQNFSKQWIFYRAAPLNFISPYAHGNMYSICSLLPAFADLWTFRSAWVWGSLCHQNRHRLRHVRPIVWSVSHCRIRFVATGITGFELIIQIGSGTPATFIFIRNLALKVCSRVSPGFLNFGANFYTVAWRVFNFHKNESCRLSQHRSLRTAAKYRFSSRENYKKL